MVTQRHASLAKRVVDAFASFWKGFRDSVESVGTAELLELRFREGIVDDWRAKARKIVRNLADADQPLVICLDELPVMLNRLITGPGDPVENRLSAEIFLSWLRQVFTAFPKQIRWIVCGSIGLEPILARHNLSFTVGHLRAFHLLAWDRSTANECLVRLAASEGAEWPEESRSTLLDRLAHFVPHHVQMYFGHVMDDCRMRGVAVPTPRDVDRVYETHMLSTRGHAELADYEERLLRVLDAALIDVSLALLTEAAVKGRLEQDPAMRIVEAHGLDEPGKALRDVLRVLEHDGYLERTSPDRGWVFVSPLIRDWWERRFGTGYQPISQEE